MLRWGEYEDKVVYGPYVGQTGLDFVALSQQFRREQHAEKEAAEEDYCPIHESDFVPWLLSKGILTCIETRGVDVSIHTSGDNEYVPKHWPLCPKCEEGRGEKHYGAVRQSLNRVVGYRRCTQCHHEWGHEEEPNDTSRPMVEDDGRDTRGACVPFSIAKACELNFHDVLAVCKRHGWNSAGGMYPNRALEATAEMGYRLIMVERYDGGETAKPTLKQIVARLSRNKNYIVAVKNHWLAVVGGEITDNETDSGPGRRVLEVYEVRKSQANAA